MVQHRQCGDKSEACFAHAEHSIGVVAHEQRPPKAFFVGGGVIIIHIYFLVILFVAVVIVKFGLNFSKYVQCKRSLRDYSSWVDAPNLEMVQHRSQVLKLLNDADTRNFKAISHQALGSEILSMTADVKESFPDKEHASSTVLMFHEAIGTYRSRSLESLNPFYWIEWAIYLPRSVLCYLGIGADGVLAKSSQIVWWSVSLVLTIWITTTYGKQIASGINNLMSRGLQLF